MSVIAAASEAFDFAHLKSHCPLHKHNRCPEQSTQPVNTEINQTVCVCVCLLGSILINMPPCLPLIKANISRISNQH